MPGLTKPGISTTMTKLHLHITRLDFGIKQTLGVLKVKDACEEVVFECKTLELPWLANQSNISCIPAGDYKVTRYQSPSKGEVFLLHDVPNRSYIEIHAGNFYTDIEGCILVGDIFRDIDQDGLKDVLNSRKTLDRLLTLMPDTFQVTIEK